MIKDLSSTTVIFMSQMSNEDKQVWGTIKSGGETRLTRQICSKGVLWGWRGAPWVEGRASVMSVMELRTIQPRHFHLWPVYHVFQNWGDSNSEVIVFKYSPVGNFVFHSGIHSLEAPACWEVA